MADDGSAQSQNTWPLVKFMFSVKIGDVEMNFQEVTGMSSETQVIEYRGGSSPVFSTVKMPGIKKYGNVTLKKGIRSGGGAISALSNDIKVNKTQPATVTINLTDESGEAAMTWTLKNAFPVKITISTLNAGEPGIESMELAHEGIIEIKQNS